MIDSFDYKEPRCSLCEGKDFYYPDKDAQQGSIPVARVIEKLDEYLNKADYDNASRLLEYWQSEAKELKDVSGELTVLSEMMGLYRRTNDSTKGLDAVDRGFYLISNNNLEELVSTATIYLNGATTLKCFGKVEESIQFYKKAEEIYVKNLNPDDYKMGGLYNNMALAYVDLKNFEEAEKLYKKALEIMENIGKDKLLEAALTLVNMAHMYFDFLDIDTCVEKAQSCMEKAYDYLNYKEIKHDGYYAFCVSKCIPSFKYFKYDAKTEELERRVKEIYDRN